MKRKSSNKQGKRGINVSKTAIALTFLACFILSGPATWSFAAFSVFAFNALLVSAIVGTAIGAFVDTMLSKKSQTRNHIAVVVNQTNSSFRTRIGGFIASLFDAVTYTTSPRPVRRTTHHTTKTTSRTRHAGRTTRNATNTTLYSFARRFTPIHQEQSHTTSATNQPVNYDSDQAQAIKHRTKHTTIKKK